MGEKKGKFGVFKGKNLNFWGEMGILGKNGEMLREKFEYFGEKMGMFGWRKWEF